MKNFIDFVKKNKYIIICVSLVIILYAIGILDLITKFIVIVGLVILAVYIGRKLQDDDSIFKNIFTFKTTEKKEKEKEDVYYYQDGNGSKSEKKEKTDKKEDSK